MKKILLSLTLICALAGTKAQVVFNEFYPNPKTSATDEYVELYNTSGAPQNLDCWSILSWDQANHRGYIYQLPAVSIPVGGFYVFTSNTSSPTVIHYGNSQTYSGSNIKSWNTTTDATQSLSLLTISGGNSLVASPATIPLTDFLLDPSGGSGIALFLFNGNTLVNAFIGSGAPAIPTDFASLTVPFDLRTLSGAAGCPSSPSAVTFSSITTSSAELQSVVSATGADHGYYRTTNGLCGTWQKSSSPGEFSPGTTNGTSATSTDLANVAIQGTCISGNKTRYNVSIQILNSIYNPSHVEIFEDLDASHTITAADGAALKDTTLNDLNNHNFGPFTMANTHDLLVRVTAQQNCLILFRAFNQQCINLPVKFNSFNAARNHSLVGLKWETAFEQNNQGFAIERNIRGTWEQVAFVPSQAASGNSETALTYQYNDLNDVKGVSQYRLRQIDFDAKASYSDIRAVRGEGQVGKTIVFPNPSFTGKVSIVFEDLTVSRDVILSDMAGRILKQWKGVTNNNIQLENLTPGMYSLKIVVPETGEQSVEKIIVSK